MYKRNPYKKLQIKNESFLNVTSLRNRDSPEAGVSCLIQSGAQHRLQVLGPSTHVVLRRRWIYNDAEVDLLRQNLGRWSSPLTIPQGIDDS